ncbi:unnamed protein product, partial [Protopolystoma xenopodis]
PTPPDSSQESSSRHRRCHRLQQHALDHSEPSDNNRGCLVTQSCLLSDMQKSRMAQANSDFVDSLLEECKHRVGFSHLSASLSASLLCMNPPVHEEWEFLTYFFWLNYTVPLTSVHRLSNSTN